MFISAICPKRSKLQSGSEDKSNGQNDMKVPHTFLGAARILTDPFPSISVLHSEF